jgi:hypothetical protein
MVLIRENLGLRLGLSSFAYRNPKRIEIIVEYLLKDFGCLELKMCRIFDNIVKYLLIVCFECKNGVFACGKTERLKTPSFSLVFWLDLSARLCLTCRTQIDQQRTGRIITYHSSSCFQNLLWPKHQIFTLKNNSSHNEQVSATCADWWKSRLQMAFNP